MSLERSEDLPLNAVSNGQFPREVTSSRVRRASQVDILPSPKVLSITRETRRKSRKIPEKEVYYDPRPILERIAREQQEREIVDRELTVQELVNKIATKEKRPARNAAHRVYRALMEGEHYPLPSGHMENTFYTSMRDSTERVDGMGEVKEQIENIARKQAGETQSSKMVFLVGPSGSGKSVILDAIKQGTIDYTVKHFGDKESFDIIKGCEINEPALKALLAGKNITVQERQGLRKAYGVTRGLCAHCEALLKEHHYNPSEVLTEPVAFSSSQLSRGVATLEPKDTNSEEGRKDAFKRILGANGGILHIAEFMKHDPKFRNDILNFIRSGSLNIDSLRYENLDFMIFAETTNEEYDTLLGEIEEKGKKDSSGDIAKAIEERLEKVDIHYRLSRSEVVSELETTLEKKDISFYRNIKELHRKRRRERGFFDKDAMHIRAERIANVAILSRITQPKDKQLVDKKLTPRIKLAIYDGRSEDGFSQKNRKDIEEDGKANGEGAIGMSEAYITDKFYNIVLKAKENGAKCLSPFDALVDLRKEIEADTRSSISSNKQAWLHIIDDEIGDYRKWLLKIIRMEGAGTEEESFEQKRDRIFNSYIDTVMLSPGKRKEYEQRDPLEKRHNDEIKNILSESELNRIEDCSNPVLGNGERVPLSNKQREDIRSEAARATGSLHRQGKDISTESLLQALPKLRSAVEEFVSDSDMIEKLFRTNTPDFEQQQLLEKIREGLINKHEFCEHCTKNLRDQVGKTIKQ